MSMLRMHRWSWLIAVSLCVLAPRLALAGKQMLWVTNASGNDVHVIDVATQQVVKHLEVGPNPHGIAAPDDASVVFLAIENMQGAHGELLWVNPRTYEISDRLEIGPQPNQIACTPDGHFVYIPCNDETYWVIDAQKKEVVTKIHTGGRPHNTQASRDGKRMFLSPMGNPFRVTMVDVESGHQVIGEIPFGNSVRPPALSNDGKRLYQHIDGLMGFQVADVEQRKVIATVEHKIPPALAKEGSRCHGLALRPDQKEIWSCNTAHKLVHVHDVTRDDFPEIAAVPMIGQVYWLCFTPDSKFCYVSVRSENKICVVETESKQVVTHISVGDTPKRNLVITLSEPDATKSQTSN